MKKIGIAAFTVCGKKLAGRIADELSRKAEAENQGVAGPGQSAEMENRSAAGLSQSVEMENRSAVGPNQKSGVSESPEYEIQIYESGLKDWCRAQFESHSDGIIFVGAAGIAVRSIAPFLKSKTTDPAVLVIDEAGQYVISLLSGHIGGANRLALMVAETIGAVPIITTATDVNGKFAVDVFAKDNHLKIGSMKAAKEISAAILRGEPVGLYCDGRIEGTVPLELQVIQAEKCGSGSERKKELEIPGYGSEAGRIPFRYLICICGRLPEILRGESFAGAKLPENDCVQKEQPCPENSSSQGLSHRRVILHLIPKNYILGIGCRRGKTKEEIEAEVLYALAQAGISMDQIFAAATIDLKKEEQGLLAFCRQYGLKLATYTAEELLEVQGDFSASEFVRKTTGVDNVCERAALRMAGDRGRLVQKKYANNGVTAAVAVRDWSVRFE